MKTLVAILFLVFSTLAFAQEGPNNEEIKILCNEFVSKFEDKSILVHIHNKQELCLLYIVVYECIEFKIKFEDNISIERYKQLSEFELAYYKTCSANHF